MMGTGPKCFIPKFMEIGPLLPEKTMLRVFTIYGRGGHLGHVTNIILKYFPLLYLKAYIQNLAKNCSKVSQKSKL